MALFHTNVLDPQIKALPTVSTASGSIASFDTDMTENLVEVKCQIVATQASGIPSPVNPLPIYTLDHCSVFHNSINMWDEQWEVGTLTNGKPEASAVCIRSKNFSPIKPEETYYLYCGSAQNVYYVRPIYYDANKQYIGNGSWCANNTFTTPSNCYYFKISTQSASTAQYGNTYLNDISINNDGSMTYHAFNGAYIPFGQTVANGVLDVTTGKLVITHGFDSFDLSQIAYTNISGIDSWALMASQISTGGSDNIDKKCNINGVYSFTTTRYEHFYIQNNGIRLYCTENTARDKIAQFVYPLATPIEIQLDSTQITALLNENNIWCDTGDTEVKYLLTVGKKIA